jgi:hypothetical protein
MDNMVFHYLFQVILLNLTIEGFIGKNLDYRSHLTEATASSFDYIYIISNAFLFQDLNKPFIDFVFTSGETACPLTQSNIGFVLLRFSMGGLNDVLSRLSYLFVLFAVLTLVKTTFDKVFTRVFFGMVT